jgi:hypothetical protein
VAATPDILTHEDDESTLTLRHAPGGLEVAITRAGLRARYALVAAKPDLARFAQDLLDGLDAGHRLVEVAGPAEGKTRLAATAAPGEDGELLLVMLARESPGDEMEAEFVRFASRAQMAAFAEELLRAAA